MSATRVFIIVEGRRTDPYFYGRLSKSVCDNVNLPYEVVRGDRFAKSGGKQTLIGLYKYLKSANSLTVRSKASAAWCVFFLDKDVDDILKQLITSPHVVYTPAYGVENVVTGEANLINAVSAASGLDPGLIQQRLGNSLAWRRQMAEEWKDFLVLCLFSHKHGINGMCRYGRQALPLGEGLQGPGNGAQIAIRRAELEQQSRLPALQFERKYRACARLVERIFRAQRQDLIFNGKWYLGLLVREVEQAAPVDGFNPHALSNSISAALCTTLNFEADWAAYYKDRLRSLIEAEAPSAGPND